MLLFPMFNLTPGSRRSERRNRRGMTLRSRYHASIELGSPTGIDIVAVLQRRSTDRDTLDKRVQRALARARRVLDVDSLSAPAVDLAFAST